MVWLKVNPAAFAANADSETRLVESVKKSSQRADVSWQETNFLLLRRGPYVIAAGLDESVAGGAKKLTGRFINLFDPALEVRRSVLIEPGTRYFLLDLAEAANMKRVLLASACKAVRTGEHSYAVEGIENTSAVMLMGSDKAPKRVLLGTTKLETTEYSATEKLLWIRFENEAENRELRIEY
jgi:hypothetical protein